MAFDSGDLFNYVANTESLLNSVTFAVRHLRTQLDSAALQLAKANAEWHDDPTGEDHAAHHAPADVQFPAEVRDAAALELFRHYLGEMAISRKAGAK